MRHLINSAAGILSIALASGGFLHAGSDADIPKEIRIDQKLDAQVPLDLTFVDEAGQTVQLRDLLREKPVILNLVYFECPMLCTLVLNGQIRAMRSMEFSIGREFDVVTVSIDPLETAELAASKKAQYLESYHRDGAGDGWHFLTGREEEIRRLADAVGFRYKYDPETKQYAHAAGIMILTPQGKVSRYFYGVEFSARDLRLGLIEASQNHIGTPVDQVLLLCYHYDPTAGKYSVAVMSILKSAGILTVLGVVLLVIFLSRKQKLSAAPSAGV